MTKAFDAVLIGSAIQKKVNSRRRLVDSYSHWTGNDFVQFRHMEFDGSQVRPMWL